MSGESISVSGACLCGSVTYQALVEPGAGACHCDMCRRWGSSPFMSVDVEGDMTISGEDNIVVYSSSNWAERGFCKSCGSNLYYRLLPRAEFPQGKYSLSAGTINEQSKLLFDHEVFVDHAPNWYHFEGDADRSRMTEAQLLSRFNEPDV